MIYKQRKHEACFESNIDYYATYQNGFYHPRVGSINPTQKGHIKIKFRDLEKVLTLISTQGTIQVFYFTIGELNACLNLLREILVPKFGEQIHLTPHGTYILVDKIRYLIQEGIITHDMGLNPEKLAELTGWEKEDIWDVLPTILREPFPFGIELKVSRIVAGCSRAEPYVEEWLKSVEQALKREEFYSPDSFEWEQNLYFELVKHICVDANYEAVVCVRAFLDGRVVTEAKPRHLAELAHRILNAVLDKYEIPYETEIPVQTAKGPLLLVPILATLGILTLCART